MNYLFDIAFDFIYYIQMLQIADHTGKPFSTDDLADKFTELSKANLDSKNQMNILRVVNFLKRIEDLQKSAVNKGIKIRVAHSIKHQHYNGKFDSSYRNKSYLDAQTQVGSIQTITFLNEKSQPRIKVFITQNGVNEPLLDITVKKPKKAMKQIVSALSTLGDKNLETIAQFALDNELAPIPKPNFAPEA